MKRKTMLLAAAVLLLFFSCNNNQGSYALKDIQLSVQFESNSRGLSMTSYTPTAYSIGMKKAVLLGSDGTADLTLFDNVSLSDSENFSFLSTDHTAQSLLVSGNEIPVGVYTGLRIELYYLQMTIDVYLDGATTPVDRNMRIYFSDDAEYEDGPHQPGDVTAIGDDESEGWLMCNDSGDFTGMSPRSAAYQDSNGFWVDFAGKNAADFGPFGDTEFWSNANQPIYTTDIPFDLDLTDTESILIEFNVEGTWNCDDRDGNGVFNPSEDIGGDWHMGFPAITATKM